MQLYDIIYHASAGLILLLGIAVLANNTKQRNSWIFSAWAFSATAWMETLHWGFWLTANSYWTSGLIVFRFAWFFGALLMALMTIFYYYFPRVSFKISRPIGLSYLFFTAFLLIASLTPFILESLVVEDGVYVNDILGALFPLYTFNILLTFLAGLYLAFNKLKHSRGIEKNKIVLVTFGYFVFIFFTILTNVILPYFGITLLLLQQSVPFLTLVFLISTFFAFQRYRFFNLSYLSLDLSRRATFYAILLLIAWSTYNLFLQVWSNTNPLIASGVGVIVAIYLTERLNRIVPEFYSDELKNIRNHIAELKTSIYYEDNPVGLQEALETTFVVKLNYVNARLYLVRNKKGPKQLDVPVFLKGEFTKELQNYSKDLLVLDEIQYRKLSSKTQQLLTRTLNVLEADVCIPLFSENNIIGFFTLQKKNDQNIYSKEEIAVILSMQRGLEITLMNTLLKLNLEEENNLMKSIINKKTKQLKKKIEEINELLKQQSDFIAVTAHEFRTPLSIAMFQVSDVVNSKKTAKEMHEDIAVINTSLGSLKALTEKLFAVQQYDLNKVNLQLQKTELGAFIKQIHSDFIPIMKEKHLSFSFKNNIKSKVYSSIDQSQLRQVFHNILNNASKFTPRGGRILMEVSSTAKHITLCVNDSGDGIPDKLKLSIFEKFRTKSAGAGIGLGLYLCKKIVALHDGKIWVDDSSLGGATFHIQLKRLLK